MKKTCLITGAAGFIGFHISMKLLKEGYNVIGFDNLNSIINYTTVPNNPAFQYSINISFVNENLEPINNTQTDYKLVEVNVRHSSNNYSPIKDIFLMTKK